MALRQPYPRGRDALRRLLDHLDEACGECARYLAAAEAGAYPDDVAALRCPPARTWRRHVAAIVLDWGVR